jgi:hypothetical protein
VGFYEEKKQLVDVRENKTNTNNQTTYQGPSMNILANTHGVTHNNGRTLKKNK